MATKKKTTKKLVNRIAIVLDRSGSMELIQKEAVDAFNQQVDTIKKDSKGTDTTVSLFTFSTEADEPTIFNKKTSSLKKLTLHEYQPNGMTAMFDAVGKAIDALSALPTDKKKDTANLVIIISDGQENNSKNFTGALIAEKVKALQDTKRWTFTYLGANQDLSQISKQLGIPLGNTLAFVASASGMARASSVNAIATSGYLAGRGAGMSSTMSFYDKSTGDTDDTDKKAKKLGKITGSK